MKDDSYHYYAFISYSHKDQEWAEWIQRAIEHYKLPAIIRKEVQKPLPKRIAPVFRDATDLGVDVLVDGLHEELEKSRFLIVVCSPNSAKPNAEGKHFVDEEVRHFCELGREKQIIPVIIEGTPQESFGPVLKSREILALDATKQPKERILNDVVAKILGLKPDVLWRRAERERKKQRIIRSILCGVMALFVAFAGYFAWDANRTVENYYADYVDSFGLPEGIFPLKKSELSHRHIHYRFEYRGFQHGVSPHADSADWCIWNWLGFRRRLVRVVQANSYGYPRKWDHEEFSDRPQIQDFKYDRDLRLREIRYGRYGGEDREAHLEKRVELWNENAVTNGLVKFFASEGQLGFAFGAASSTTLSLADVSASPKSEITMHLVQRDSKGRIKQRLFLNNSAAHVRDADGLHGFSYEHDELGRQTMQWYLFQEGEGFCRRANKKGVAGQKYGYSGRNMSKVEYVDVNGRPILGPHDWIVCEEQFDAFGNSTASRCLDADGKPTLYKDGFAGCIAEYDERGNMTRISCFGVDGQPTLSRDGYAELRMEYDERGNIKKVSCFGVEGKPTLHKDGHAEYRTEYDARGNVTKMSYFGVDGKPTLCKDGFAEVRMSYDSRGNMTKQSYFDVDGKPTPDKDGVAETRVDYEGHGKKTKASCFGVDGKPTRHKDGYAEICWGYDGRGNMTNESYFGVDSKPTLCKNGFAAARWEYDGRGNMTRQLYCGTDGKPTLCKDGNAEMRQEYDERGNVKKVLYLGVDGNPTLIKDGYAEFRQEYDSHGNVTKMFYFGVDGMPTVINEGYAGWEAENDDFGRETYNVWLGVDGHPTLKDGVAGYRKKYDARGNVVSWSYFGVDGKPKLHDHGYAEVRYKYDMRGNKLEERYFGVDGEPKEMIDGTATKHYYFDTKGRASGYLCLDINDRPKETTFDFFAEKRVSYNELGNVTNEAYYGANGKPIKIIEEYAACRYEYDVRGNVTRVSYFGEDGKPTLHKEGYAGLIAEYDARGNRTRELYFGEDGQPKLNNYEVAEVRMEYDSRGNVTRVSYFGEDGKPTLHKEGYAGLIAEYDARGNRTRELYFGEDGQPKLNNYEVAEVRMEYDTRGLVVQKAFFGIDGKPKLHKDGCAVVSFIYAYDRTVAETEYFDVSGKPIVLQSVALSVEILSNSAAEKLGVKEGDVLCRLGSYDILNSENYSDVTAAIQTSRNQEKELIVARKVGEEYEIHAFKFPIGLMGIRVEEKKLSDFDKLKKAYKAYCDKNRERK